MVKVTDELRERVIELRKSGATYQEIEKLTGLRQEQINRILKKDKEEGVLRMSGEEVREAVSYTHPPSPRDGLLSRMPSSA